MWISKRELLFRIDLLTVEVSLLQKQVYDLQNQPKYTKGKKLEDGTIITNIELREVEESPNKWLVYWHYEGVKNGAIVTIE